MEELDDDVLRAAVDHSPDGVVVVDSAGTIRYANAAVAAMSGYEISNLVGRVIEDLIPDRLRHAHSQERAGYVLQPRQRAMGQGLALSLRREDASEIQVEISLSPLVSGDRTYVIAAVRDITPRLEAENRLLAAREQLALADERDRIGRELHDTVLQRLYGLGLVLQAAGEPDPIVDEIDRIIAEIRTAVFTLGTASRPGSLGQELAEVIAQSARLLGFTPRLRIEGPVESVIAEVARGELVASMREALGNVARHAKASEAGVVLRATATGIEMVVTDNGIGPPADIAGALRVGNGLRNLNRRAGLLGGECHLARNAPSGAVLRWWMPYDAP
jgi:PAS domain S-box-containing protein